MDFWPVRRIACLEISRCRSESVLMKVSDIVIYIMKIKWRDLNKFVGVVSEIHKKALKSKFWMQLHLDRWWENGLAFKIARTKIHQNFLATKYDIKQHSDAIFNYLKSKMSVIPLFSPIRGIIHPSTSNICVRDFSSNRDLSHNSNTIC